MASNNRDPDAANMDMIVELLKRQESNMNRRLDMLENKLHSFKLEITENIKGLEERVKVVEKSAEFIASQYESQKKIVDKFNTKANLALRRKLSIEKGNQSSSFGPRKAKICSK